MLYLRHQFLPKLQAGAEFKTWGHWGPLEHLTAAESMKAYLVDKGVIEWPPPVRVGSGRAGSKEDNDRKGDVEARKPLHQGGVSGAAEEPCSQSPKMATIDTW